MEHLWKKITKQIFGWFVDNGPLPDKFPPFTLFFLAYFEVFDRTSQKKVVSHKFAVQIVGKSELLKAFWIRVGQEAKNVPQTNHFPSYTFKMPKTGWAMAHPSHPVATALKMV